MTTSVAVSDSMDPGSAHKCKCNPIPIRYHPHHSKRAWLGLAVAALSVFLLVSAGANAQQSPIPIPTPISSSTRNSSSTPSIPTPSSPANSTIVIVNPAASAAAAAAADNATLPLINLNATTTLLALNCTSNLECPGQSTFCHPALKTCQLARCGLPQLNVTLLPCMLFNVSSYCTHLTSGRGTCAPQLPEGAACNPDLDLSPWNTATQFRLNATHLPNVNVTSAPRLMQRSMGNQQCLNFNYCSPFSRTCVPDPQFLWRFDTNNREGKLSVWSALLIMVGGLVALAGWVALCTSGMIRCSRRYQRDVKLRWCVDRVVGGCCCCCFKGMRKRARRQPVLPIGLGKRGENKGKEDVDEDGASSAASSVVDVHPMVSMQHPPQAQQAQQLQLQVPFSPPPLPPRPTHQQLAALVAPGSPALGLVPPPPQLAPVPAASPLIPQFDPFGQFTPPPPPAAAQVQAGRLSRMEPAIADGVLPPMAPMVGVGSNTPGYGVPAPPMPQYRAQPQLVYSPSAASSSSSGVQMPMPAQQQQQQPRPWNAGKS